MWTAKRVLILMGGLLVSLSGFAVYTIFLGGIDGLPPLPSEYFFVSSGLTAEGGPIIQNDVDLKLDQAFGSGCEELRRPYRLWLPEKGIAIAAGQFEIEKDGRVRLAPLSIALFHKSKVPGPYPEISAIRCDVALLTLDRPVTQFNEFTNRKLDKVELQGKQPGISLVNNRRTAEKSDDVDILVTNGPLYFESRRNVIWTDGVVRLTDYQTKPPTIVSGKGLEMLLAKETTASRPKNARPSAGSKQPDNGGIEQIILRAHVDMHFWVDSRSGFLTGSGSPLPRKAPAPVVDNAPDDPLNPRDKAHIRIHTGGTFVYDLIRETAWFESPQLRDQKNAKPDIDPLFPDQVHVQRSQKVDGNQKFDQLTCDRLDLQFRRRGDNPAANAPTGGDKEIESAKATSRPGSNEVVLSLDTERMAAYGNYLFFRSGDGANGAQTTLKGLPLKSYKEGHRMTCQELVLTAANKNGDGQSAEALGEGMIELLDSRSPPDKPYYPTHVSWRDKLVVVKDREGNQAFDLMKVYGKAAFIDEQQKQEMHGETIFVWVLNPQDAEKKSQSASTSKQELHRVVAQDNVRVTTPEFRILHTERFTMTFLPEIAQNERLPDAVVVKSPAANPAPAVAPMVEKKEPARPPIDLQAKDIAARVFTLGAKKELQELIAKGNVFVHQPGDKPGEKRIDMQGNLLTIKHMEQGKILVVHGKADKVARLEVGDLIIWGPLVTINQADNRVEVDGVGAMEMPTKTNIDGTRSNFGGRMTIQWNKNMTFDGKNAEFWGGVQAFQNGKRSSVKCQNLQAILDRYVSFKEGQERTKQDAQIDRIICDKNVVVVDVKVDEKQQLVQHVILEGRDLVTDNQEGPTNVSGTGRVIMLAMGNSDLGGPNQGPPVQGKDRQTWKVTRVEFPARMYSNTKGNVKNAKFYASPGTSVEVYHFPTTKILDTMNPTRPVKDGLFLSCDVLSVEGRQNDDKMTQSMIAEGNVTFRTDKYEGQADLVKFDETNDTIIMEAIHPNSVVRLSEYVNGIPKQMQVNSRKVLYNRKTGKLESDGVKSLTNGN